MGDKLKARYKYDNELEPVTINQTACFYEKSQTLYFDNSISKSEKAAAIANHIFNLSSLNSKIELFFL